jgi:uncharacterized membrane protein
MESTARSIAKAVSWRIAGTASTFIVTYLVLGDITISGTIAFVQLVLNTLLYIVHERIWNRVTWGR